MTCRSRNRGKRLATATALAGLGIAVAGGLFYKQDLEVEWHIRRLDSPDESIRLAAMERLIAMRAVRAVPRLVDLAARDRREQAVVIQGRIHDPEGTDALLLTTALHAIHALGPEAMPVVEGELERMREASCTQPGRENCAFASTGLFFIRVALERPQEWVVSRLNPEELRR